MNGHQYPMGYYQTVYDTDSEAEDWRERYLKKEWQNFSNLMKGINHRSRNIDVPKAG